MSIRLLTLFTYGIRTTSVRGTAYELPHTARGMKPGAFDAQGLGTTDFSHFIRRLGSVDATTRGCNDLGRHRGSCQGVARAVKNLLPSAAA